MMDKPKKLIRCLIIDDEAPARRVVAKYLSDLSGYEVSAECKNAFEALEALKEFEPELIFLDINMPKLSGLKMLESLKNPPLVIITTAYREYAVEGFELDVVDYLHKPFSLPRFIQALNKVQDRLSQQSTTGDSDPEKNDPGFIFLKHEGEMIRIDVQNIEYVEAVGDYVQVVASSNKYLTYQSMKKTMALLGERHFYRVHKSFIVNLGKVNSISGNMIFLRKRSIPIGGNYRAGFMKIIKSHMA
ncbi:MAG: response regulator transcription factor [Candidatus Marinimicrobia bacterium]|nr:response regulator transcription factor [Candidatus Neomarinimicrobiota bacterium]